MSVFLSKILNKITQNETLTDVETNQIQTEILTGKLETLQILEFLKALDQRTLGLKNSLQITGSEFTGFLKASQKHTIFLNSSLQPVAQICDSVGTGGDGLNTFNISTVAGILAASMGIKVAKHGNRSTSSICGSADLFESFGYQLDLKPMQASQILNQSNFVFLFAKSFNPSFRFAGPARKKLAKKSYFNFLGPLLNPAKASIYLLGVSDFSLAKTMIQAILSTTGKEVWAVKSKTGLDEIVSFETTEVLKASKKNDNEIKWETETFEPAKLNFKPGNVKKIQINSLEESKQLAVDILKNQTKNLLAKETVILNAGILAFLSKQVNSLNEGVDLAKETLEAELAYTKLQEIVELSQKV